jgi:hypothetical protein
MQHHSNSNLRARAFLWVSLPSAILLSVANPVRAQEAKPDTTPSQTSPVVDKTEKPRKTHWYDHLLLGPDAGVYLPSNARTRDRFGSTWFDIGPGFGSVDIARDNGRFSPDIHILGKANEGNSALFVMLGAEYRRALLPTHSQRGDKQTADKKPLPLPAWIPYTGGSLNLMVGDLISDQDNIGSGIRNGAAASAFIGITYKNRGYVEARYIGTTTVKGFDLSGWSLSAGVRFRL